MMRDIVWFAALLTAKLYDPITLVLILVMIAAGAKRWPAWSVLPAAIITTLVNVALVYSWWVQIGVADQVLSRSLWLLTAHLTLGGTAYGIGRLVSFVVRKAIGER